RSRPGRRPRLRRNRDPDPSGRPIRCTARLGHDVTAAPGASRSGASYVIAGAALFGTIGTARVLGPEAPAASVGALRLTLAASILVVVALPSDRGALVSAWRLRTTWVAGVAQAAFNLTFLAAVTRTGVAVGTLV